MPILTYVCVYIIYVYLRYIPSAVAWNAWDASPAGNTWASLSKAMGKASTSKSSWRLPCWKSLLVDLCFIELDDGKIYRKTLYLMVKTMVSCKFSLKPIHWSWLIFVAVTTSQGEIGGSSIPQPRFQISREQIEDLEAEPEQRGEGTKWVCVKNVRITTETIKFHEISIWLILDLSSLFHEHNFHMVGIGFIIAFPWTLTFCGVGNPNDQESLTMGSIDLLW